jgi:hypothetical protein
MSGVHVKLSIFRQEPSHASIIIVQAGFVYFFWNGKREFSDSCVGSDGPANYSVSDRKHFVERRGGSCVEKGFSSTSRHAEADEMDVRLDFFGFNAYDWGNPAKLCGVADEPINILPSR